MPAIPNYAQTSSLGQGLPFTGTTIQFGSGSSPSSMSPLLNVSDLNNPFKADVVDVTNAGNKIHARIPVLVDAGPITMKVFYMPQEPTHRNATGGIRYAILNGVLMDLQIIYPDGSSDDLSGYFTDFSVQSGVGKVFEASCAFQPSDQTPAFC